MGTKQITAIIFRPAGALKINNHIFLQTLAPLGQLSPKLVLFSGFFLQILAYYKLFSLEILHHYAIKNFGL